MNGQAFVVHIWDDLDCRIDPDDPDWSPGWQLIEYITHTAMRPGGMHRRMQFAEYIESF
jgi:hypothetical protein